MINCLTLHMPNSTVTVESDNISELETLSDYCKENLCAYHASEDINELTIPNITPELSEKFYTLLHKLSFL